ncbi:Bifunctional hemolysin/adenylate cyclase [Bradyrhizobium ivorense]|uniref:Bifunctional hemolysin/adenylate cyclase n=1 Tax=Bradyrhizobium ivorense TaxID=2511166 RepID=A0A508TR66_9BRAD|nr:calcium-binding protein [Bradyrhizobium ivorense]VIO76754.1 Bifunctional hemolysin/adenylate cyclase [Bradyrhizobium ivorense]
MPIEQSPYSITRTSALPEIVQSEDDGSIANANWTGLSAGVAGTLQANGFIGDGPFGLTSGDHDGFRFELAAGWSVSIDVDAIAFGTHNGASFDSYMQLYDSAGTEVANADDNDGLDGFLTFTNVTGTTQTYTVFLSDLQSQVTNPNNSGSSTAPVTNPLTDTGFYRLFINTFDPGNVNQGRIIVGTGGADALDGTAGNDVIELKGGNDTSNGNGGNDVFRWDMFDGSDTIDGGGPFQANVLDVLGDQNNQQFTVGAWNGFGFLFTANDLNSSKTVTVQQWITNLDVHGGDGNDSLAVNNAGGDLQTITFWGDAGDNSVAASGIAKVFRIFGGDGNDTLVTGSAADTFYGNDGDDFMNGGLGTDELNYAAIGRDLNVDLNITTAQNTGGAGFDTILNIENVVGGSGWDTLHGNTVANYLIGGAGNDKLLGGEGAANTLQGGTGNDTYFVEAAGDTIVELLNEGTDSVQTTLTSFTLAANVENLTKVGSSGFTGVGNGLANIMTGGSGNDYLVGFGGNDTFIDGSGANTFQGGTGNDIYAVQSNADTVTEFAAEGFDQVQTFLSSYTLSPNVEQLVFIGSGDHTGVGNSIGNTFVGGAGTETWTGAGGNDVYNFRTAGNGLDIVTDFNADNANAAEHDHIDLTGRGLNFASLAVSTVSGGVVVGIPGGDAIFLQGVSAGAVDANDFFF